MVNIRGREGYGIIFFELIDIFFEWLFETYDELREKTIDNLTKFMEFLTRSKKIPREIYMFLRDRSTELLKWLGDRK